MQPPTGNETLFLSSIAIPFLCSIIILKHILLVRATIPETFMSRNACHNLVTCDKQTAETNRNLCACRIQDGQVYTALNW